MGSMTKNIFDENITTIYIKSKSNSDLDLMDKEELINKILNLESQIEKLKCQ